MSRREVVKATAEHEQAFRATFRLRDDLVGDPEWEMAYEHAATHALYADELNAIGQAVVRREPVGQPAPNPSGPDPEAVRRALAEIDQAKADRKSRQIDVQTYALCVLYASPALIAAARAWLAQQDGEANHGP